LFVDTVPRLSGAEQSLADLAAGLHDVGVEPVVCLPGEGPLSHHLRARGVLVRTVPMDHALLTVSRSALVRKPWLILAKLFSFLAAGRRIRKLIRELDPMVVHTNTLKAHLLCVLPCMRTRTPLVWHVRDILPRSWVSAMFIWFARFASVIIVPSRAVAEPFKLSKKVFRKVRLVPNGIRVADFVDAREDRSLRQVLGVRRGDPVVGLVGRIAPWKGQEIFLRAASMLAQRHPNARFAVIGAVLFPENDAPFDAYLRRLVLDLRLQDNVIFLGHQPAPEAMAACDVVVHCSLEPEPFGRVIAEAMAAGKPVIAAAGGATAEILPPAAGFIVPPGRPELLADALDRLLADRELREHMGVAGADVAASFFDLERVVLSVAQIHRALAARNARKHKSRRRVAVRKVTTRMPKRPKSVRATRRAQQPQLSRQGWHRDARGVWVPPVDAPAPSWDLAATQGRSPGFAERYAPEAEEEDLDERNEIYAEETYGDVEADEYEEDLGDVDDEDLDADEDELEDEPFDDESLEDEGGAPSAGGAERPIPVAYRPDPTPAAALPKPAQRAQRGVAILDLTEPTGPKAHRAVPARVSGGQTGVVARVVTAPDAAFTALSSPTSYPLAPVEKRALARPFPRVKPHLGYAFLKRTLDLVVSTLILVVGSPLWLGIALGIKLGSSGPVLHRGTVHGVGGRSFTYYKFRSMRVGSSDHEHRRFIERYVLENGGHVDGGEVVYKLTSDDRVTNLGRFIRRLSLDEIPQLLNVLRGDMSLVGPRPPLDYEYELYDDRAMQRLSVRPGITGLQQVWARNMASFEDKLRMDLNYIRERSIWMDVKLLLHTVPSAFRGH
jgi:lipopolysaccharide/colanic/teichoic acid biosynthesis glycosyltransferase/glycosyltransferase involved in cell wall biosynthesis